jgi:hypothetical protein
MESIPRLLKSSGSVCCPAKVKYGATVDLQSLFEVCVYVQLYSLAETPQPQPLPPHLVSYTRALLVSQDRRHLFMTPWL